MKIMGPLGSRADLGKILFKTILNTYSEYVFFLEVFGVYKIMVIPKYLEYFRKSITNVFRILLILYSEYYISMSTWKCSGGAKGAISDLLCVCPFIL